MFELRRPSLRLVAGLAIALAGFVEIQSLVATLQSQGRLRDRVTRTVRASIEAARPRFEAVLAPGAPPDYASLIAEARATSLASEVSVLDPAGRRLAGDAPAKTPGATPSEEDWSLLREGGSLTLGPLMGASSRIVTYVGLRSSGGVVVLRLATAVPELVQDLRDRRPIYVSHAVALTLLAVAGALVLFPAGPATPFAHTPAHAYEAAMERLHERSVRDQVQLRLVEEDLREKAALARSGELAAGIAHEMRNGLATVVGYARLIQDGSGEAAEAAAAIRAECETLEVVITRFMDFIRDPQLNVAPFDLGRTLRRVVARESRGRSQATVESALPADAAALEGDEDLLERALENLVRNALEAAGPQGRVEVGLVPETDAWVLTIADDGPGLPREQRENPRPFHSTKARGLGLGLPIAVKIIRLHGGDFVLADREPHGLRVTIRLPRKAA